MESLFPKSIERETLVEVEGVSLLSGTAEKWDLIKNFRAQPDDLLICAYPKAGKWEQRRSKELLEDSTGTLWASFKALLL